MQDFRALKVWEKAHELTLEVYRSTARFPSNELYGLTNQIRRAAASIPSNIAEGCGRSGGADFARFLQIAMGSASELEYHLLLAGDLEFLGTEASNRLMGDAIEIKRMLTTLIRKVRATGKLRGKSSASQELTTDN